MATGEHLLGIWWVAVTAGVLGLATISQAKAQAISTPTAVNAESDADRFTARLPEEAELAQPTQISLDLPARQLQAIDVCGAGTESDHSNLLVGEKREVGCSAARVLRAEGMHRVIEFYPLNTGRIQVAVTAIYADMHFSEQTYDLDVRPSSKNLKHFYLNHGMPSVPIVLGCGRDQASITPEADYQILEYPLYLHSAEQIQLSVEQPENDPVIRVDPKGTIRGLRPGKAVITGNFDGVDDTVTVNVYTKERRPAGFTCGELHSQTEPWNQPFSL